jgi:hypothetical protein
VFTCLCVCLPACVCVFTCLCVCLPDSPPTKALAQVMGNLRFRVKGLKKKRVQPATTSRLDEEKPLGRPSGRSPFPGQTAPDQDQTAPDQGQTAPDPSQIPEEPGERACVCVWFAFIL